MTPILPLFPILAQADAAPPPAEAAAPGTLTTTGEGQPLGDPNQPAAPELQSPFGGSFVFILLLMFGGMILLTTLSGRKEKKRKAEMISSLRKGARVQMAGGMLGSIVDVRDTEVVVKIDENSNTRARFLKSAVTAVLDEPSSASAAPSADSA